MYKLAMSVSSTMTILIPSSMVCSVLISLCAEDVLQNKMFMLGAAGHGKA